MGACRYDLIYLGNLVIWDLRGTFWIFGDFVKDSNDDDDDDDDDDSDDDDVDDEH